MKIRTLVCSSNRYFLESFSSYAMEHGGEGFEFSFFSDKSAAAGFLNEQKVELVLAERTFFEQVTLQAGSVGMHISNRTRVDVDTQEHELNVYQRGVDILEDMRKIMAAVSGRDNGSGNKAQKIITFYSPQGGSGKTTMAYICALLCARNGSGIYLNMEEFGYTDHLYQAVYDTTLEEVMFAIKDKRDVAAYVSNALKKDNRNVSVMPKMNALSDFNDLTLEDAEVLVQKLLETTGSKYLFVDLSGGLTARNKKMLEMSDISFWVFTDDAVGQGKIERLKADQSMQEIFGHGRTYFLINKCKVKSDDTSAIRIPFSESLSQGADVDVVLSGNRDFYQRCAEIVELADR